MPVPRTRRLLNHADRIVRHTLVSIAFVIGGILIGTFMVNSRSTLVEVLFASRCAYFNGRFGTLSMKRVPCGIHGAMACRTEAIVDSILANDACFIPEPGTLLSAQPFGPDSGDYYIDGFRTGWPLACLQGTLIIPVHTTPRTLTGLLSIGSGGDTWFAPIAPRWGPLSVNLLVGALLSLLLSTCTQAVRRHRRTKLGRCPKCAYDRANLPREALCPECGANI